MKTSAHVTTKLALPLLDEPVKILSILVQAGDTIEKDQPLFEFEQGKAITTYPSPRAGTIQEVLARVGDTVSSSSIFLAFRPAAEDTTIQPTASTAPQKPSPAPQSLTDLSPPALQPRVSTVSLVEVGIFLYERFEWPQIVGSKRALSDFLHSHAEQLDLGLVYEAASLTAFADGWSAQALQHVSKLLLVPDGTGEERRARACAWISYAMTLSKEQFSDLLLHSAFLVMKQEP
jgi:hypothetical protein